LEKLTHKRKNL